MRLDGMPLALELAAARIAVLPAEEIERLLDQRFRLLTRGGGRPAATTDAARDDRLELRAAGRRGTTIVRAAIGVRRRLDAGSGAGDLRRRVIAQDEVVYVLIALIEKSLVVADEDGDRYRMLETVREYAREKLPNAGGAEAVSEQHRDHFLALAVNAEPNLAGPRASHLAAAPGR